MTVGGQGAREERGGEEIVVAFRPVSIRGVVSSAAGLTSRLVDTVWLLGAAPRDAVWERAGAGVAAGSIGPAAGVARARGENRHACVAASPLQPSLQPSHQECVRSGREGHTAPCQDPPRHIMAYGGVGCQEVERDPPWGRGGPPPPLD